MGGTFSKANRPLLPGPYFNEDSPQPDAIIPNSGSIVAIPFTHDWGPFKVATLSESFNQWQAQFSQTTSPGSIAVKQAFVGEGVAGAGGAGAVLSYRTGSSSAAKAAKVLQNTTPANAVTLTALYEGTKGNQLTVTTQDTAGASTFNDLIIKLNGVEVERYTYLDADLNTSASSLIAQINANSNWVAATNAIDGVALGVVTNQALTGGNDGATLVAGDWTALMAAVEVERFGLFAPYDLTDGSILTSLALWAVNLNLAGKRFMVVVGGALNESNSTANTRSGTLNNENILNLGQGSVSDFGVVGASGAEVVLSTSQLAPRIAGIAAQRGEVESMTFGRLAGVRILAGPTEAEKLAALKAGTTVIGRDSNVDSPVRLEKALTTYTTTTNTSKPYVIYRNPKFVRTIHGIEMEFTDYMESSIIGKASVNDKTRDAVRAELSSRLQDRVVNRVIQAGFTVTIDQDPPPSDDDEFIALVYGIRLGRSAEQTFGTLRVG